MRSRQQAPEDSRDSTAAGSAVCCSLQLRCTAHTAPSMPVPPVSWYLRRYWHDKGVVCIITGRLLNLAALGFTIAFSGGGRERRHSNSSSSRGPVGDGSSWLGTGGGVVADSVSSSSTPRVAAAPQDVDAALMHTLSCFMHGVCPAPCCAVLC